MPLYDPAVFYSLPNELLWVIVLLVNFFSIILLYRYFGRLGLYIWIPISVILANLQVLKLVTVFGMPDVTLGNIVYAGSFLVTDILSENYGKKDAQRAVSIGFFTIFITTLLMNLSLIFEPGSHDQSQTHLVQIFGIMPRLALGSVVAYILSQRHDVWAYAFWRKRWPSDKFIWLRNNLSTMVSQLIDTLIFTSIAFLGAFELPIVLNIFWTTYLMKWLVAAADTPFIYWAKRMKRRVNEAI